MGGLRVVYVVDWVLLVRAILGTGRADIGGAVILAWRILIHGVIRGLREVRPCGNRNHDMGFSFSLLHSIHPKPLTTRIR